MPPRRDAPGAPQANPSSSKSGGEPGAVQQITSVHNPRIKDLLKLEKRAERIQRRLTRVEGAREAGRALAAGVVPVEAYLCPELAVGPEAAHLRARLERLARERGTRIFTVTPEVFARLVVREESGGIVLVIPFVTTPLADLPLRRPPFVAVVDRPEKPGNLGAILRTADAAGVDAVVVCGGTDVHNPNVVRASLGTLFTVPVAEAPAPEAVRWLQAQAIRVVVADPAATRRYTEVDLTGPVAVVAGSEAEGLDPLWLAAADEQVTIPMFGQVDSLNLATSMALLLYEVIRQRRA
jgi:TrmH family RNA methyltransferase